MISAKEIRDRLRARAAEELRAREDVVLRVADVLEKRAQAGQRLLDAERAVGAALQEAAQTMTLAELAELTGQDLPGLRRLARASTDLVPAEGAGPARRLVAGDPGALVESDAAVARAASDLVAAPGGTRSS